MKYFLLCYVFVFCCVSKLYTIFLYFDDYLNKALLGMQNEKHDLFLPINSSYIFNILLCPLEA